MSLYVPVLKGYLGELVALRHAWPPVTAAIRPVLEVIERDPASLYNNVLSFGQLLMDHAPKDMAISPGGTLTGDIPAAGVGHPAVTRTATLCDIGQGSERWAVGHFMGQAPRNFKCDRRIPGMRVCRLRRPRRRGS